ncbi:TetR family transcriptional regulator [Streptomyces sp. NPDC060194]|uniref:TetR/AcrR family transcriptional regulator n=1 Tax=Streptomyces sp. NPDC060194 TaxID=3347069 RepID=UPI0036578E27
MHARDRTAGSPDGESGPGLPVGDAKPTRRTGRRTGPSTTRTAIAEAAVEQFAGKGYGGASIRSIAEQAQADPALVMYFFGSKRQLFQEVLQLPFDPSVVVPQILAGDRSGVGRRLAEFAVRTLRSPGPRDRLLGLLRSASQDEEAAAVIRSRLTSEILEPIAEELGESDARFRAAMAMSQIAGLAFAHHVIGLHALQEADESRLVHTLGITLQRYLTGPLE